MKKLKYLRWFIYTVYLISGIILILAARLIDTDIFPGNMIHLIKMYRSVYVISIPIIPGMFCRYLKKKEITS